MTELQFSGVIQNGNFQPDLRDQWYICLGYYDNTGNRITISVDREHKVRSNRQNARYWVLIVPTVIDILSQNLAVPLTKKQVHWLLASRFVGEITTELGTCPAATRTLTTEEFAEFNRKVEEWLLHKFGLVLPERGEDR